MESSQLARHVLLKKVIHSCATNIYNGSSPNDIAQCLVDIGVCLWNLLVCLLIQSISRIIHWFECYSVSRISIKEINSILKCKYTSHRSNSKEAKHGWTENGDALDPSLFCKDTKGITKLSVSITKATHSNLMPHNKHN